jgi:hypothetical protein
MAGHKGYIAGGCFKNIFNGEKIKDVDVFFENEKDFKDAVDYYENEIDDYVFSYENKNTVAYKNKNTNVRVELVRSQFGKPEELLKKFDFSITKFAYCKRVVNKSEDSENLSIEKMLKNISPDASSIEYYTIMHEFFFDDLINKKLVLEEEIFFPVSTFERILRYTKYGYGLCRESKKNILTALSNVSNEDIDNLSETLYFGID